MKTEIVIKSKKKAVTTYVYEDVEETYYVSEDGKKKSKDEGIVLKYEYDLLTKDAKNKLFNTTPISINNIEYPCGFAFYLEDERAQDLFYQRFYSWHCGGGEAVIGKWFTYSESDGGDMCLYWIHFYTLEDILTDAKQDVAAIEGVINKGD